jgi:hypothetical protein
MPIHLSAAVLTIGRSASKMVEFINAAPRSGLVMEFGVATGSSITGIAGELPHRAVYGFDSFEGLPEDWVDYTGNVHNAKGTYAAPVPSLAANVELVIGLFQDTLPVFLARHPEPAAFVHIDCDLYSSTRFVLAALRNRMRETVVVFDEFCGLLAYEANEGRAWREFINDGDVKFEKLGEQHSRGAAFKVTACPIPYRF